MNLGPPCIDLTGQRFGKQIVLEKITKVPEKHRHSGAYWLCLCDCGNTNECRSDILRSGASKSCGCAQLLNRPPIRFGAEHHSWKGGRHLTKQGYVRVLQGSKHVMEHRMVMEQIIGRKLTAKEQVHHKNGIKDDNRIENLELKITHHGPGQSIEDMVEFWTEKLREYAPERLDEDWL